MKFSVPLHPRRGNNPNFLLTTIAAICIYSMVIPLVIADILVFFYQNIYFRIMDIPMVRRRDYMAFDHWDLSKLNLLQKINCYYCDYGNGLAAYIKAVVNQTEAFSCAIKHREHKLGQEHQAHYLSRKEFE